jgi:hypothetical protein
MKRLRAILERIVVYPTGDHWSGDTEGRKALRSGTHDQTVTCSFSNGLCGARKE